MSAPDSFKNAVRLAIRERGVPVVFSVISQVMREEAGEMLRHADALNGGEPKKIAASREIAEIMNEMRPEESMAITRIRKAKTHQGVSAAVRWFRENHDRSALVEDAVKRRRAYLSGR